MKCVGKGLWHEDCIIHYRKTAETMEQVRKQCAPLIPWELLMETMLWRHKHNIIKYKYIKEFHFCVIFLPESLYYQWLFVSLQHENPPSLSTMLKCAGRFCFYGYMATRIPFIKTYSTPHELVQLLKTRGMEITDRLCIIFSTSVTIVCLPICTHCFLFPRNNIYSSKE